MVEGEEFCGCGRWFAMKRNAIRVDSDAGADREVGLALKPGFDRGGGRDDAGDGQGQGRDAEEGAGGAGFQKQDWRDKAEHDDDGRDEDGRICRRRPGDKLNAGATGALASGR